MKLINLLALFALMNLSSKASASIVSVTKEIQIEKSPEKILEILRDHENTCHSGCLYKMTNLKESHIIEKTESYEIVWQRISGIRETKQFVISQLTQEGKTLRWLSSYPHEDEIKALEESSDLDHVSTFTEMTIDWNLTAINPEVTNVKVTMTVDHTLSAIGDPIVQNSIEKTLRTLFYNFQK